MAPPGPAAQRRVRALVDFETSGDVTVPDLVDAHLDGGGTSRW